MSKPKEVLKKALSGKVLTKEEIKVIASNAQCSKIYAQKVLEGRFIEGEEVIKTNAAQSYLYAKDVILGEWKDGENIISKDPLYALRYAQNVLRNQFPKGEKAIATNGDYSYEYSRIVGRFEKGEEAIIKDCSSHFLCQYAINALKNRWPEAEEKILKDKDSASAACLYACHFSFRWEEAEKKIIENARLSVDYAREVIRGRWEEAEKTIATCSDSSVQYAKIINERFVLGEDGIIQDENIWTIRNYLGDVLNGNRWDKLENYIENYSGPEDKLIELIDLYGNCVSVKLPDFMHNRMLALAITNSSDWSVRRYFDSLEERENQEKLLLVRRFSIEKLKEILSKINE